MRKVLLLLLCMLGFSPSRGQDVFVEKNRDWLKRLLESNSDTTYVLNFWATWCVPCVEELPEFEPFAAFLKDRKAQLIFISLDAPKTANATLTRFLKNKKVPGNIVVLNAPDYNAWIDLVDPSWQGSIPATLFFRGSDKKHWFAERTITHSELLQIFTQFNTP
jgi:thiol-disulfide isomerase/thioredoxin